MSDNLSDAEAKLMLLGERVRIGREILHPVTERDYKTVQDLIHQQWQKKETLGKTEEEKKQAAKVQETDEHKKTKEKEKAKTQDPSQSYLKEASESKGQAQQSQSTSPAPSQGQSQGQGHSH